MEISLKRVVVACALALASTTAFAQTVEVPTTISPSIPEPGATTGSGLILTLFSANADVPWSYSYYLGLTVSQVSLLTSDIVADGKELAWNLPSLAPIGSQSDLRWHVTGGQVSSSAPGGSVFLTTTNSDYNFTVGPTPGLPTGNPAGYLQNSAIGNSINQLTPYASNLTAVDGNPDITTNPAEPYYQGLGTPYGLSIAGFVQNAGLIGQALPFYLLTTADNPNLAGLQVTPSGAATVTRYQSSTGNIGQWLLDLENATLRWQVAGDLPPVPLPAAAWLLLSGLAGIGVIGRRRRVAGLTRA